ncbi:protein CHUP1, chloroplastic [Tanacetum coccineum]
MLAPSGGGLILYQAYGNLYAMTGRKAHLLEDKQIPSVGVFDEVVFGRRCICLCDIEFAARHLCLRSGLLKQESWEKVSSCSAIEIERQGEEAKDLAKLPLDELIKNLKVYEMVLDNDGIGSKTTKEKVKSLALKAKVTREQTSNDSDSQGGSDEDIDEEEAEAFNLLARNFRKGNRFGHINRFCKGRGNSFENKGGEISKQKGACYNCGIEGHFSSGCIKSKERTRLLLEEHEAIVKKAMNIKTTQHVSWENEELLKFNKDFTKTFEKLLKEKRSLENENSKVSSKINDLEIKVKKLKNDKEVVEPCKICDVLTKEVDSLKCNVSRLQDEALNFSKFKESSIALDDMLSCQKLSQDKKGLGFSKNDKTTSASLNKPIVFVKESKKETFSKSFVKPVSLKCDILSNDWIVDSGCTKHMTRNRRLFTSYKAYDGGHVISRSNLKGKVIGGGYPKSLKEARGHPIEQVIGELNERTLRTYVKGMEVKQHCCFNEMKDKRQYIIQTMVDISRILHVKLMCYEQEI